MRGVNPALRQGQDGVEVADLGSLRRLLTDFPQVRHPTAHTQSTKHSALSLRATAHHKTELNPSEAEACTPECDATQCNAIAAAGQVLRHSPERRQPA